MRTAVAISGGCLTPGVIAQDFNELFENLEDQVNSGMATDEILAANEAADALEQATPYDMSGTTQHCHQPWDCEVNEALGAYCCKPLGCSFDLDKSLSSNEASGSARCRRSRDIQR